uniref:Uncharacterized protein n=1 Tax=Podoviridae sp. ctZkC8 TaxID=2825259 RepID=A0A8S5UBQ0_9CAUD|nr:MAG TPA: hypothetical protein [Podoviridae sp. ctZkC8]
MELAGVEPASWSYTSYGYAFFLSESLGDQS